MAVAVVPLELLTFAPRPWGLVGTLLETVVLGGVTPGVATLVIADVRAGVEPTAASVWRRLAPILAGLVLSVALALLVAGVSIILLVVPFLLLIVWFQFVGQVVVDRAAPVLRGDGAQPRPRAGLVLARGRLRDPGGGRSPASSRERWPRRRPRPRPSSACTWRRRRAIGDGIDDRLARPGGAGAGAADGAALLRPAPAPRGRRHRPRCSTRSPSRRRGRSLTVAQELARTAAAAGRVDRHLDPARAAARHTLLPSVAGRRLEPARASAAPDSERHRERVQRGVARRSDPCFSSASWRR